MSQPNLRPLTFGEILDGAFSLYRRNFATFFLIALVPFLPLAAIWIVLGALLPPTEEGAASASMAQLALTPYSLLATILVWGALTHQAARAYHGETVSMRDGYAAALRRFLPLLGVLVVTGVLMTLGLVLLVVPGILVAIMFFAAFPAVVLEGRGVWDSMQRSRALARDAWGRIFAVIAVLVLITALPAMAIGAATALGAVATAASGGEAAGGMGFALAQVLSTAGSALTTPLFAIGILLQYYDRRVRAEGLDLELATERLAPIG